MVRTDKTLDIKGVVSPRAELITEKTLAEMHTGQVLTVLTTDKIAKKKLPSLCETLGCTLLDSKEDGPVMYFQIKK